MRHVRLARLARLVRLLAMSRTVSSSLSIGRRFSVIAAALCVLLLALTGWSLSHLWRAYADAERALSAVQTFRAVLLAAEKVSVERGPTNGVLGEDFPIPEARRVALQRARDESDLRVRQLLERLDASDDRNCCNFPAARAAVKRAQVELSAARANVDRLTRMPRSQRTDLAIEGAVDHMVEVIPQFSPIADASGAAVINGAPEALNSLVAARLAATLREQAGLLGSRFTAALASHRPLTEAEHMAIERTRGGIDQLHALIASRVQDHPALSGDAFVRMNEQYFGDGLADVARVRALASRPGGAAISTAEFAQQYVPLMRPIIEFRDEVLDLDEAQVRSHRDAALALLVGAGGAASILLGMLFLVAWLFRQQVVRPFVEATRVIRAIATGELAVEIRPHSYRGEIRQLFEALHILQANNIERSRLEQERRRLIAELRTQAETDSLTRLLNRRAFESRARAACLKPNAREPYLALVMFDIDHFKQINDTYGHAAGDRALQRVADLCRKTWRETDIVARIGGEEFAALIGVQDCAQAVGTSQRLRAMLSQTKVAVDQNDGFTVTASFGIAFATRANSPDMASLLKRADGQLYRAKLAGRDRVEVDASGLSAWSSSP
jgi:diguanylate cyclase (GGDEF)-like protein